MHFERRTTRGWLTVAAVLTGMGLAAVMDGITLHQLLHWHHFDHQGSIGPMLTSDGLFHGFAVLMLVAGVIGVMRVRDRTRLATGAGLLLGFGGFNFFDGIVVHKVLRLHQIRHDMDGRILYDIAWFAISGLIIAAGIALYLRGRAENTPRPRRQEGVSEPGASVIDVDPA